MENEDEILFQYIGCVEVLTSMKVLDFDTRSAIAKECIHRVCEEAGVKGFRCVFRRPNLQ